MTRTLNLQRANDPDPIVRMKGACRLGGDGRQPGMEDAGPSLGGQDVHLSPERRVPGRSCIESAEEGAKIQPRASHHHRQAALPPNLIDRGQRVDAEPRGLIRLVGVRDIDHVVPHGRAFRERRLAGRRVDAAVDLARIGADDGDGKTAREGERGGGLADAGGTGDDEQGLVVYQVRLSSFLTSLKDTRETMGRP